MNTEAVEGYSAVMKEHQQRQTAITEINIDCLRSEYESEREWKLRRKFLYFNSGSLCLDRLNCLSRCFVNISLYGCLYSWDVMREVYKRSSGILCQENSKIVSEVRQKFAASLMKAYCNPERSSMDLLDDECLENLGADHLESESGAHNSDVSCETQTSKTADIKHRHNTCKEKAVTENIGCEIQTLKTTFDNVNCETQTSKTTMDNINCETQTSKTATICLWGCTQNVETALSKEECLIASGTEQNPILQNFRKLAYEVLKIGCGDAERKLTTAANFVPVTVDFKIEHFPNERCNKFLCRLLINDIEVACQKGDKMKLARRAACKVAVKIITMPELKLVEKGQEVHSGVMTRRMHAASLKLKNLCNSETTAGKNSVCTNGVSNFVSSLQTQNEGKTCLPACYLSVNKMEVSDNFENTQAARESLGLIHGVPDFDGSNSLSECYRFCKLERHVQRPTTLKSDNIDSLRDEYESSIEWNLRRKFLASNSGRLCSDRLICLSRCFVNMALYGCSYPWIVMKEVHKQSAGILHKGKSEKKIEAKLKYAVSFVKASNSTESSIDVPDNEYLDESDANQQIIFNSDMANSKTTFGNVQTSKTFTVNNRSKSEIQNRSMKIKEKSKNRGKSKTSKRVLNDVKCENPTSEVVFDNSFCETQTSQVFYNSRYKIQDSKTTLENSRCVTQTSKTAFDNSECETQSSMITIFKLKYSTSKKRKVFLSQEECLTASQTEPNPVLKKIRKLAYEVLNLKNPSRYAEKKLKMAGCNVPVAIDLKFEPAPKVGPKTFMCHVFVDNINVSHHMGKRNRAAKIACKEAIKVIMLRDIEVVRDILKESGDVLNVKNFQNNFQAGFQCDRLSLNAFVNRQPVGKNSVVISDDMNFNQSVNVSSVHVQGDRSVFETDVSLDRSQSERKISETVLSSDLSQIEMKTSKTDESLDRSQSERKISETVLSSDLSQIEMKTSKTDESLNQPQGERKISETVLSLDLSQIEMKTSRTDESLNQSQDERKISETLLSSLLSCQDTSQAVLLSEKSQVTQKLSVCDKEPSCGHVTNQAMCLSDPLDVTNGVHDVKRSDILSDNFPGNGYGKELAIYLQINSEPDTQTLEFELNNINCKAQSSASGLENNCKTQSSTTGLDNINCKTQSSTEVLDSINCKTQSATTELDNINYKAQSSATGLENNCKTQSSTTELDNNNCKTQSSTTELDNINCKTQSSTAELDNINCKTQSSTTGLGYNCKIQSSTTGLDNMNCKTQSSTTGLDNINCEDQKSDSNITGHRENTQTAKITLSIEECLTAFEAEKNPVLKKIRKLAYEILNMKEKCYSNRQKLRKAGSLVPVTIHCESERIYCNTSGNLRHRVFIDGIEAASLLGRKKNVKKQAYEEVLKIILMPKIEIVERGKNIWYLKGSVLCHNEDQPGTISTQSRNSLCDSLDASAQVSNGEGTPVYNRSKLSCLYVKNQNIDQDTLWFKKNFLCDSTEASSQVLKLYGEETPFYNESKLSSLCLKDQNVDQNTSAWYKDFLCESAEDSSQVSKLSIKESYAYKEQNVKYFGLKCSHDQYKFLDKFIVIEHEDSITKSAEKTLRESSIFNHVPLDYKFFPQEGANRCIIKISGEVLADVFSSSKTTARAIASEQCLEMLKTVCWVLKSKDTCITVSKKDILELKSEQISSDNIGNKLLQKMGWSGGGIGKTGQGISEPVFLKAAFNRQGLGFGKVSGEINFKKRVREFLQNYYFSGSDEDLLFSCEFEREERIVIHEECRKLKLQGMFGRKGREKYLRVSRKKSASQLFEYIMSCGGETQKYKLLPPGTDISLKSVS